MLMSGADYRESLRRCAPRVYHRQPGRCCIQGGMVPLPDPKVIALQKMKA
jgi:hypothetical protein